jgi:sigma-B regulation protein RsbU (phosphoserine phosphatase)
MASPRVPDKPAAGRRRPAGPVAPAAGSPISVRDLLLHAWPGRLFIISATLKILVAALRQFGELHGFVQILSTAATIGLLISVSHFVWRLFVLMKRRLLWRVRRKLILSYIFIGVVPALLIVIFFLLGGVFIFMNVSAYLFRDGYEALLDDVKLTTEAAAADISRASEPTEVTLARIHRRAVKPNPNLSLAFVPIENQGPATASVFSLFAVRRPPPPIGRHGPPVAVGAWQHMPKPTWLPPWLRNETSGTIALKSPIEPDQADLVIRAAVPVVSGGARVGFVIGDLPVDVETVEKLDRLTNVRAGPVTLVPESRQGDSTLSQTAASAPAGSLGTLLRKSVIFLECRDWNTNTACRASVSLSYRPGELYSRLSGAQQITVGSMTFGESAILLLLAIAGLFLIIECVALVMGLALARTITSSVHELFMGTERVRQGDFGHRIEIYTKDQLGELAQSFNQMTGSIEGLLQTAAEKKRLEEELRIARQIQMSLLPRGPIDVPGLSINALCVPAREVGGDYYDFFPLQGDRLGVLIADVSGKGTSAALYMAELKGVVLALSQQYESPRDLLIEVNRIISDNLDSRSFITITYAVIDLTKHTMTYCRAGHTPLIFMGGSESGAPQARILTPSGMVLGLRIEGAAEKFADLLEEECVDLGVGDVIVLYTDGISEAMNADSDLFGEERLSQIVEEHGHLDSSELRERILREIEAFVGDADQHDDMTMILLKVEQVVAASERVAV